MKLIVTGGSGFIGRATIAAAEAAGHEAESFDRAHGHDVLGSLTALASADAVIHLAGVLGTAELFDTAEEAVINNVVGSLRVMQACVDNDAGYVGITMPQVFDSIYTATKVCSTRLGTALHKFRGLPVSHVRAFNAFGAGQAHGEGHPQKILPTFATEAWHKRPIPIWGNGTQTVDLVHTDDLARMLVDAARFGDDQTFDGGTGVKVTVNDVADFVRDHCHSSEPHLYMPMRDGEEPTAIVAEGEGWDLLGWQPKLDWADVAECVDWYRPEP